jgi:cobalt-precorrin 5A hydrolase
MNEAAAKPILVIGLGCQRGCPALVLRGLIEVTLVEHQLALSDITALASIDRKSQEPGLLELAEELGLPLHFFSAEEMAAFEPQLTHRSLIAYDTTGCYGVAESAALALSTCLTGRPSRLLIQRRSSSRATFSLATAAI